MIRELHLHGRYSRRSWQMYVADERFKKNIDKYGDGAAEFAAEGIRIYAENK